MPSAEEMFIGDEQITHGNIKGHQVSDNDAKKFDCLDINNKLYNEKDKSVSRRNSNKDGLNNSRQAVRNSKVTNEDIINNLDDEHVSNRESMPISTMEFKSDTPIEQQTIDRSTVELAVENDNQPKSSMGTRNNRLIAIGGVTGIKDDLEPIIEYAEEPLLPLAEACIPLEDILYEMQFYVKMALEETPEVPPDGLTIDESAAIRLYTIEWEKPHRSLYSMLNYTLKTAPRPELQPYFKYMKLFLTALVKLPCVPPVTVWRGVTKNLSGEFPRGTLVTWWAFSSCTTELTVLENDMYLGNQGDRTLFSVEVFNGRTVRAHSHFVTEDEILLLPGTHMEVQSIFSPAPELHIVHLKQIKPTETLLELPFEGALLYPPEPKKVPWYKRKQTIAELTILVVLCLVGVIVGAVIGSRRPPPPPQCYINITKNLRADYLWSFNCGDAREDKTGLYNGTTVNGASFVTPDFSGQSKALNLNRNFFQYVTLPRSLNLTLNTSFTVSTWFLLAGYQDKTLLSDCNNYNPVCIAFIVTDSSINIRLLNWDTKNMIQEIVASTQSYMCHNCWMYASFSFDYQTKWVILYLNGMRFGNTYMNITTNVTSTGRNQTKATYIGLNSVTQTDILYGLIDRLCITYYVKNDSEILFEATVVCRYLFNTDDINAGSGTNNIRARSQNVYRFISNNESSLLLNSTDSYFQSAGFTLLGSNSYAFSLTFWLRLIIPSTITQENSAITILQLTSLISGLTDPTYTCVVSLHVYANNNSMGLFFPETYEILNVDNSSIVNNTWVHIGIGYNSASNEYIFYQNGQFIYSHYSPRYSSLINNNPRLSLTIGGAYLNGSATNKPDNFDQMKCFARLPIFNYTNMYGNIDYVTGDARLLSASEFAANADPKTRT